MSRDPAAKPILSTESPPAGAASRPAVVPPRPFLARLGAYRLLLSLATAVFVVDQLTKLWIVRHLPFNPLHLHGAPDDIVLVRGFFYLIHVGNTGAAWSMFTGRSVLLAALSAATLLAIFYWRRGLGLRDRVAQLCFGLLCGGIAGNFVDRLIHQHVIDFVDLHFGSYVYPTFNVADSGICVGVILYLWHSLREPR